MDEWEDWETVSIEHELDKMRDERHEREKQLTLATGETAPSSKIGCVSILLYFIVGLILFRIIGDLLSML